MGNNTSTSSTSDTTLTISPISTIAPMVTTLINQLIIGLFTIAPVVSKFVMQIFEPKIYSVTIRSSMIMSPGTSDWTVAPEENNNDKLISSLLEFMSFHGVYPDEMRCNLGS